MTDKKRPPVAEIAAQMGMSLVTPHLCCRDAGKALDFYKDAFGAEEIMRLPGPDGRLLHASMRICGGMVMLNDEFPEYGGNSPLALKGTPVTIHLMVDDVDAAAARAVKAGATVVMEVADQFWGDRYGVVADPFGHHWSLATPAWPPKTEAELKAAGNAAMDMD